MSISDIQDDFPDHRSDRRRTREEIIRAVTEGEDISDAKTKVLVIPPGAADADAHETAASLNIDQNSRAFEILKIYCEQKKASAVQAKVLMQRVAPLSEEQLNLLRLICGREDFRARDILRIVSTVRKFGSDRLLILHAFVGLEGAGPGPVDRLCVAAMPQVSREEVGQEAYEAELREKAMTREQIDVFYNICTRLTDITPGTALALLPKTRALLAQHTQMLNLFLKKDACFGEKPLTTHNILGLMNLWLSLPQINDPRRFKKLMKKLSRQSEKKKMDFQFLIHAYKSEAEKENAPPKKGIASAFKRFLD